MLAGRNTHEFNNLLQVIGGYTRCVMEEMPPEDDEADLRQVLKAADRAATLTSQLLGFSRRRVLQPANVDPNAVVADVAKMLQPLIGDRILLQVTQKDGIGTVYADAGEFRAQAALNLCLNARDAMPDGGLSCVARAAPC